MDSQVVMKTQDLAKAEDMRLFANWENYLIPAPLSIAFMGELVFLSSNTDFSINTNPPKDGYKFIKYPESFRACLMQVCNSGWQAFNEAQKNMDKIRLDTLTVPDNIEKVMKILFQADDKVITALLPHILENIRTIAEECQNLAQGTVKHFTDVNDIIQELLEACSNAETIYGKERDEIIRKLDENKIKKAAAEKAAKDSEQTLKEDKEKLLNAQQRYDEAVDSFSKGSGFFTFVKIITGQSKAGVDQTQKYLQDCREIQNKSMESMIKDQKELTDILVSIRSCEVKEINFKTTIEILIKVLEAMGKVEEQWNMMVQFFQLVANIVEISLNRTLKDFGSSSKSVMGLSEDEKLSCKDMINKDAIQASNIANFIYVIASTYTEVSTKYLMNPVNSLEKLMTMDPSKGIEFKQEQHQLRDKCDEAERVIQELVSKKQTELEGKITERPEKIDKEQLAILPAAAP